MEKDIIYEEKIFPKVEMYIFSIVIALLFFVLIFAAYPALDWFLLLTLLVLIVIMFNFRKFNIKMTPDSIIVKYGFSKRTIPWENIGNCYLDKTSAIWYGGWGLRMGRVNGKWRDVYNVLGYLRVVLLLKDAGFFKEFVFSTKNPEQVMKIINKKIKKI